MDSIYLIIVLAPLVGAIFVGHGTFHPAAPEAREDGADQGRQDDNQIDRIHGALTP